MSQFDPLELIPRAYSLPSLTDYTGIRGSNGSDLTKLDIMGAVSASRLGQNDIGPELMMDCALIAGGLRPIHTERVIAAIRAAIGLSVFAPVYSERCASVAANRAYVRFACGKSEREACSDTALSLGVRYGTYLAHGRAADEWASEGLNRATARFKRALR